MENTHLTEAQAREACRLLEDQAEACQRLLNNGEYQGGAFTTWDRRYFEQTREAYLRAVAVLRRAVHVGAE